MGVVYRSAIASLVVQLLVTAVTASGFSVELPLDVRDDLNLIFALELGSQVIEFLWYLVTICRYREVITWTRYIDWVLSTPVMITTLVFFFRHRNQEELLVVLEQPRFYAALGLNWLMLSIGFASEVDVVAREWGLGLGGACLVGSYTVIALYVDNEDSLSIILFFAVYFVWFLYGVAAAFNYTIKNVAYNSLDIISKNCFGVFLFIYALNYEALQN